VRPTDGGYALVDLGSTNGTMVNGRKVREHELEDGDRITIGRTTIDFRTT
jgi:pSer/pThr/pTyr-binding forkhead associated (FHA) protein